MLSEFVQKDKDDKIFSREVFTYDRNGSLIKNDSYSDYGYSKGAGVWTNSLYKYDINGK